MSDEIANHMHKRKKKYTKEERKKEKGHEKRPRT